MSFNLGGLLAQRAHLSPDKEGFIGSEYRYTYAQVNQRANRFAAYLESLGLAPGERVAILCKNREPLASSLFGAAKAGCVSVLMNWRLQVPELSYILQDSQAAFLLYDAEFAPVVEKLQGEVPVRHFLVVGAGWEEALAGQSPQEPKARGGDDDPAVIMYTSGTTGRPKGATLSHRNLLWSTLAISHTVEWDYRHRFLLVAPLFHIGGLAPLVTNVHKGITSYFMPDFDPVEVWRVIAQERISNMMSVPLMLLAMLMASQKMEVDASSLVTITCGASPVPASLIQSYLDMGIKVQQVYGTTECAGAVSFWTHEMDPDKMTSQGKPVFHLELKVVDPESGRELPPGQVGEIWCRGPMVFVGYWNQPQATEQALRDGWYRTGDLGRFDEDGYLFVVDRLKDMIISGGENVYPAELEKVISSHPAVAEVAVIGRPDPKWGEIPVACVVRRPQAQLEAQEVVELCREQLAAYKCVKDVVFLDELPKNSVGKVLKTVLREQA